MKPFIHRDIHVGYWFNYLKLALIETEKIGKLVISK
jgi:hypothetical protein